MPRPVARLPTPPTLSQGATSLALPLAVAAVAIIPFIGWGTLAGHDFLFHIHGWAEAAQQFREGVLLPRWAAGANFGIGEPRFLFYPPLSWMTAGVLWLLLPVQMVAGAYAFLCTAIATASMRVLAGEFLSAKAAAVAAVLYGLSPYLVFDTHARNAYGELLAAALLPLVLLAFLRILSGRPGSIAGFGAGFALLWLADVPGAIVVTYALAAVALFESVRRWSIRLILRLAAGGGTAFCLGAFYLVPVIVERTWVQSKGVLLQASILEWYFPVFGRQPNSRLLINFLFLSAVALFGAGWIVVRRLRKMDAGFAILGITSVLLMLPPSAFLWTHLPLLGYVQFPWRFLLVLNPVDILLLAALLERLPSRVLVAAAAACAVAIAIAPVIYPRSLHGRNLMEKADADVRSGRGYIGTSEYWTPGSDPEQVRQAERVAVVSGSPVATVGDWTVQERRVEVNASSASRLRLRLMYYPAWRATINGEGTMVSRADNGLLEVAVPAGTGAVSVRFGRTLDRTLGAGITIATMLALFFVEARRRSRARDGLQAETQIVD